MKKNGVGFFFLGKKGIRKRKTWVEQRNERWRKNLQNKNMEERKGKTENLDK